VQGLRFDDEASIGFALDHGEHANFVATWMSATTNSTSIPIPRLM
jgi:hypothetical protein